ncbi:MAG: glycosyltransferase [candidate division Zixibacteria bacterium]|nr:glycosyltransferase [candidate division Zixibacteria bacterium]
MNIILGFPQADLQTGRYLLEAFEELGHKIVAIHDPLTSKASQLLDLVDMHKPDFIFLSRDITYNETIEQLSKKTITVMWNVDVRDDINLFLNEHKPLYKYCHLKFTIGKGNLFKYKQAGIENIYWLSEGISPVWHRTEEMDFKDILMATDVVFAGSNTGIHRGRRELLNILEKNEKFEFMHYTRMFNRAHNKMCQSAKINIGNSGWSNVELSMSARDYRIMGAGGFLLTNHIKGIENWFEVGKMCDTYKSPEECLEKIEYYLEHEDERKAMAKYGQEVVHAKHKFSDRLKEVVERVRDFKGESK